MHPTEATGKKFDLSKYLEARDACHEATQEILANLWEGMTEKDGHNLIEEKLKSRNSKKRWHPNKFRIGPNTTKSFKEVSDEGITLKSGDNLFIDIGPVFGDHEADFGRTSVFGENQILSEFCESSKTLFDHLKKLWLEESLSGEALYQEADKWCKERSLEFNHKMAGHRLCDFPHALITRDSLASFKQAPTNHLWVLEVHILNPKLNRGSFFEDILTK